MKQIRFLTMLALLLMAATGAWAQWTGGTHTATANENLNAINVSDDATLTINQGVTVTVNGGITVASGKTLTVTGGGTLVANGANGTEGEPGQTGNAGGTAIAGNVIINGVGLTVTATGGEGGEGGGGDKGSDGDTNNPGGEGGTGGTGGNGGYAFAGTLMVFGGNVNAYGGDSGQGGADGYSGSGGTAFDGGEEGEIGEPGEMGEYGSDGVAYASNVTFQATTHTMTDGTDNITAATGKKTVIIMSPDVLPGPPTYAITLAEGTEDFDNWTISPTEAAEGAKVTATYSGEKKVKSVKAVKKEAPADPLAVPMTIEAITPGIISISNPKEGMQYSKNGGAKTAATTSIDVAAGDKVQFYGNGTSITSYKGTSINGSGNGFTCKVYGNIMSLVDETGFATATTLSGNYNFYRLFYGNTTLTDASGLLLPATTLVESCYNQMFMGCTPLTTAPVLPATTLAENCYYRMFYNCGALTAAPELPATKLAADCYNQMFSSCTSLTAAPELPATELASNCYRSMFMNCTALTTAPVLPATTLVENCYYQMFTNCTGLTTVPSDLPATTLVEYCYYKMFMGCTALTTAPVLTATTLVDHCYYGMFDGCSKLATVTSLAESGINTNNSTTSWLNKTGTQAQGTKIVYTVSTANWPEGNTSGIPAGWTRVNVDN